MVRRPPASYSPEGGPDSSSIPATQRDRRRCFIRECLEDKSQDKDSWVGGEQVRESVWGPHGGGRRKGAGQEVEGKGGG